MMKHGPTRADVQRGAAEGAGETATQSRGSPGADLQSGAAEGTTWMIPKPYEASG